MAAPRIIAVSPDEALGKQLATVLTAAGGLVDLHRTPETLAGGQLDAALCVLHLRDDTTNASSILPRLSTDCRVLTISPRADLGSVVELMQTSDRVAGMLVADAFDARRLYAVAVRLLTRDIFGLEKVMKSGTQIHSQVVGDYHERSVCISRISAFAEQMGVPQAHHTSIEQCLDELLMNALYDAPVDADGKPIFAGISTKTRTSLSIKQSVAIQYACDGIQLAISVRDAFGSLDRQTVLGVLHKCLHAEQKIDRKAGGAGVGLYLIVNSSTTVGFNVVPGVATEVVCTFDLAAPRAQLEQLGFYLEPVDVTGALVSARQAAGAMRPVERPGPRARSRRLVAGGIAVAMVAVLGAFLVTRRGGAATPAIVDLDSQPTGARVIVDGKPMGETPLTLSSLDPGTSATIAFQRTGYAQATAHVEVPKRGERTRHVQSLARSEDFVLVRFVTKPPGARVIHLDHTTAAARSRTYTPAEVFVEAGKVQRFMLSMPQHVPVVIPPFTPARGTDQIEKVRDLVAGANLRIEARLAGKVTVAGAPHCQSVAVPANCTLAPGRYVVDYTGSNDTRATRTVDLSDRDTTVQF